MNRKCHIIAEVGSVHDGSFGNALKLIEVAADCGVDAVKFQTHIAAAETIIDAPMPSFFKGEPRYTYFQRTSFDIEQWREIKKHCEEHKVEFLSSPFSIEAFHLLEKVGVSRFKIPSGENTNLPLLSEIAKTRKQIILSSGMSSWNELDAAIEVISRVHRNIVLLQCTSEYPCSYKNVGLNVLEEMRLRYDLPVGLSDHTVTPYASFAAVTLGAEVIERHFTFSRKMYGSDAKHSLEPDEMSNLVQGIRAIEIMMSEKVDKNDISKFQDMKDVFEKSLVTLVDIPEGTRLSKKMLGVKKPGTGISASRLDEIIGCHSTRLLKADSILLEDDIVFSKNETTTYFK
jgi:N,N'-diacetyllegionaminate synthase